MTSRLSVQSSSRYLLLIFLLSLRLDPGSAGFSSKNFMKGLILGHALGMKKFIHLDAMHGYHHPHHHHLPFPHAPPFLPYPVMPVMPPVLGSSVATSSVAVATPNALPMTLPLVGGAGVLPASTFAANGALTVNGLGLAGSAAINPFGLNLLPQGVISPFALNPL